MSQRKPPSPYQAMQVISMAQGALAQLESDDGLVLDSPEAVLRALVEDTNVDIDWALVNMARAELDADAEIDAANSRIEALTARRDRATRRKATWRERITQAMLTLGIDSFKDAEFSLSLRDGPAKVFIVEEENVPSKFVREVTTKSYDKVAIRKALDAGEDVPGASLGNSPAVLTIRTR